MKSCVNIATATATAVHVATGMVIAKLLKDGGSTKLII